LQKREWMHSEKEKICNTTKFEKNQRLVELEELCQRKTFVWKGRRVGLGKGSDRGEKEVCGWGGREWTKEGQPKKAE